MSDSPLITVVVPVYNVRDHLVRCHESIMGQDYANFEVVYVDDGSTDGSDKLCDEFAREDKRCTAVHKRNAGLGYARNSGIDVSRGRYIVFLDSDDYFESTLLSDLAAPVLAGQAEFTLAGFTRDYGTKRVPRSLPDVGLPIVGNKAVMQKVFVRMLGYYPGKDDYIEMSACARLYDRELIMREGIRFNSERDCLSEDLDFNARYLRYVNSAFCTPCVGYFYCDNQGSLTTTYRRDRFAKQVALRERFGRVAEEYGLGNEALIRLDNTLISMARYCIKLEVARKDIDIRDLDNRLTEMVNNIVLREALERIKDLPVPLKNKIVNRQIEKRRLPMLIAIMKLKLALGV